MSEVAAKTGLDDYLVAGGTVQELLLLARPFEPVDLARERLKRDEGLQAAIAERWRILRGLPLKATRQNTAAAVVRVLTHEAQKSGELVERGGRRFVRVVLDRRTLAERAAKSKKSVNRAIEYLEDPEAFEGEGRILRDNNGRQAHKAGAFLLPVPTAEPIAQEGTQYGGSEEERRRDREATESFSENSENFSPLSNRAYDPGGYPPALEGEQDVPALRYSKVILYQARREGRDVVAATHYVKRLGEKRGQIIRHVLEAGGRAEPRGELLERFASQRTRPWDFDRRVIGPIVEAGIFVRDGSAVVIAPDWREALERKREEDGELEDAERQRERHAKQRKKYRENYPRRHEHPADRQPELMGKEKVRPIVEARKADDARARIERQRQKAGITAAVFLADEMKGVLALRWQELRARWTQRGGRGEDLRLAVQDGPYRFEREEADERHLYVYHGKHHEAGEPRSKEREPARVLPITNGAPVMVPETEELAADSLNNSQRCELLREPPKRPPKVTHKVYGEGVYEHPPSCDCEWCAAPPAESYVKTGGAS